MSTLYLYEAIQPDGKVVKGSIQADGEKPARSRLREMGLVPLSLRLSAGRSAPALRRRALHRARLATWTRQMGALLKGGLPLERALATLAEEAIQPKERELAEALRAEVSAGATLHAAMNAHPADFDESYRSVVAAGEASGSLAAVMQRMAGELEQADTLRQKIVSAMLYPLITTIFAVAITVFLMTYVVPQVAESFESARRALPAITQVVLALSSALRQGWWVLLGLAAGLAVAWVWARRQPALRLRIDRAALRLPVLGALLRQYQLARFGSTLALLSGSGVPILKSLQTAADTLDNQAMKQDVIQSLALVREGASLASALGRSPHFKGLLVTFTRLGEQTGELSQMIGYSAEQMSDDVQRRSLRLASLMEPLLIIVMGGVVMTIVLSVMLPLIQLNQLVR